MNSQASLLLQAADFVAGTLAQCYDETVLFTPMVAQSVPDQVHYNAGLAELCVGLSQDFLHRKLTSRSPQEIDRVTCLHYLLFHFRHVDPTRYISSRELMAHIEERRNSLPTLHYFQTRMIAPLRDAGVIVASSTKGYKIPSCEQDLYDFVNHSNTIIQPLLSGSANAEIESV